jgi:hypothetical protein
MTEILTPAFSRIVVAGVEEKGVENTEDMP